LKQKPGILPQKLKLLYNFRYLDWSRAVQDVNTALSQPSHLSRFCLINPLGTLRGMN